MIDYTNAPIEVVIRAAERWAVEFDEWGVAFGPVLADRPQILTRLVRELSDAMSEIRMLQESVDALRGERLR